MKKIIAILLAIFLCASTFMLLTACGSGDGKEGTKNTTSSDDKNNTPGNTAKTTVTEAEWKAALGSFDKIDFALEIDSLDENGEKMETTHIVTKNAQKVEGKFQGSSELVYYVVEDNMIVEYSYDEETEEWSREEYAEYTEKSWLSTYNYATDALIIDEVFLPEYLEYKSFTYDAEDKEYVCKSLDINYPDDRYYATKSDIEVSFVDGKIANISYVFSDKNAESENMSFEVEVSCEKDDVTLVLPNFAELMPSAPALSEEEWKALFSLDYNAYQLKVDYKKNGKTSIVMMQDVYGDVIKTVEMSGGAIAIDYMENAEGGHYYYNDETESGDINAPRTYVKMFISLEDTHGEDEFEDNRTGPEELFNDFDEHFAKFSYDTTKQCYFAETIDTSITNVSIYVTDGKITKLIYDSGAVDNFYIEIAYEDAPIQLPTVG